jgi:peroxiredoxin
MKKVLFALIAFPLAFLSFTSTEETKFEVGDQAPMLEYEMANCKEGSNTIRKAAKKNGVVVVFSCNTCPFVVGNKGFEGWEKQYNDLYEHAKKNDMGFILVNSNEAKRDNEDSPSEMVKHAKEAKYKMDYLIDTNSELANAFGAKTTPHVFVLNAEFTLVYKGTIDNSWDTKREQDIQYLKPAIEALVNGKKIMTTETAPKGCSIKRK